MVNGGAAAANRRARLARQRDTYARTRSDRNPTLKRTFMTDASRPRRWAADTAKRKWYAQHRSQRFADRQARATT